MKRHPSRSVLRQMQDEPGAVAAVHRTHGEGCAICRRRNEAMAATAATAAAVLSEVAASGGGAPDPLPALRRLRAGEPATVAPRPTFVDRLRARLEVAPRRVLRGGAVLGVVGAMMATLVATGVASDVIKIFQPETFAAVPIDITSLSSLPDLSGFGTVTVLQAPQASSPSTLAEAASTTGLHLLTPGRFPSSVKGNPSYHALTAGSAKFTFSAAAASGTAGRLGKPLPTLPANLDGSSLTITGGPLVIETVGSSGLGNGLLGAGPSSAEKAATEPGAPTGGGHLGRAGLLGAFGGIPQLVIVQMKAPALYSDGPTVAQYEDALLSMPGIPASLAAELKALGNPSSTLPIPIPTSLASAHAADVNGAPGLVIGDTTGIASGVIWESHGLMFAVAGSLTDRQVVDIARSMH